MNQNGMYYKATQEYLLLQREKRELMQERDKIDARLGVIEDVLADLIEDELDTVLYDDCEEYKAESEDKE